MNTITRPITASLAALLIFFSLTLMLPKSAAGQTSNDISIIFTRGYVYTASGNSFTDSEIEGDVKWSCAYTNAADITGEPIKGLTATLDSDTIYSGLTLEPDSAGPPTYHWSIGDVPQTTAPDWVPEGLIGFFSEPELITYRPGFDVSWSVDKTVFTSEDTQTITVTLNPRETRNYHIGLNAGQNPLVETKISPPQPDETGSYFFGLDDNRLDLQITQPPPGTVLTCTFTIQVTPTVPKVEFLPNILITATQEFSKTNITGSSFSRTVPQIGTWTWMADGEYNYTVFENIRRGVLFPGRVNDLSLSLINVNIATCGMYRAQGDNFTSQPVQAARTYTSQFVNNDQGGLPVSQVALTLSTQKTYQFTDGVLSQGNRTVLPEVTGPPEYRWSFGNIPNAFSARGTVGIPGDMADFTPGFDISRVVDTTDFNESGTQSITINVTARETLSAIRIYVNLIEDRYINPTISNIPSQNPQGDLNISPDKRNLSRTILDPEIGVPYTLTVEINVELKPGVTRCSYLPMVSADTYTMIREGDEKNLSSISLDMPGVGTWIWNTAGTHTWHWEEWTVRNVIFETYSEGSEDKFTGSVPLPREISIEPEVIGTNVLLASIMVVIFYLAVTLFNSTFKENYTTIQGWIYRLRGFFSFRRKRNHEHLNNLRGFPQWLEMIIIILVSAVINSIISPSFGFSEKGLIMFIAMIVTVVVSTYSYNGVRILVMKHNYRIPATIKAYPMAIILAVIFVVVSRLISFHPGFIFGFVGAFTILPSAVSPDTKQKSIGILWGALVVVILAAAAFMLRGPLSSLSGNIWSSLLDTVLVALFVGGLERLLFGLIPMAFLDGGTLASWKKWVWILVFVLLVFLFIHLVINKTDTLTHAVKDMNVINIFGLVLASLVFSILFWAYFYVRSVRARHV